MMRALAGLLALVLVGFPLLIAPSEATGTLSVIGGMLCAVGIGVLSVPLVAAGAAVSLVVYTLVLWPLTGPAVSLSAVALGVVISLLFQVVGFAAHFHGAAMDSRVHPGQVRYWVGNGIGTAVVGVLLSVSASGIALRLPMPAYPAVVALGALAVFLGLVQALIRAPEHVGPTSRQDRR